MKKLLAALAALTLVVGITTAASGSARGLITGKSIKNYSVTSVDLQNHTIQAHDMSNALINSLKYTKHAADADWATGADYATTASQASTADSALYARNATLVGGFEPTSLIRAASGKQTAPLELTADYQALATLSITAPNPGFVLVTATAKAEAVGSETSAPSVATARLRELDAEGIASNATATSVSAANPYATIAATSVFPVGAAGPHTYVLEASKDSGAAMKADGAVITAIYVPFDSTGNSMP